MQLQYLNLAGCSSLHSLPESFTQLIRLNALNLKDCSSLSIPQKLLQQLARQLQYATITGCTMVLASLQMDDHLAFEFAVKQGAAENIHSQELLNLAAAAGASISAVTEACSSGPTVAQGQPAGLRPQAAGAGDSGGSRPEQAAVAGDGGGCSDRPAMKDSLGKCAT